MELRKYTGAAIIAIVATLVACAATMRPSSGIAGGKLAYEHDPTWPHDFNQFSWAPNKDLVQVPGVAVDRKKGLVYVLMRGQPNVRIFREDGTFVTSWSLPGKAASEHMIYVDPNSDLWIVFYSAHIVTKVSPEGKVLLTLGTPDVPGMDATHFNMPTDVTTTPDGKFVFVSDGYTNNRVAKFDSAGNYISMWGGEKPGTKPGEFNTPHSIVYLDGKIYVADRGNGRVQVFDLDGRFLSEWRDILPLGLAVADGRIFVSGSHIGPNDTINGLLASQTAPHSVLIYTPNGELLQDVELMPGLGFGVIGVPHAIDVGADGGIYIADLRGNAQKWRRVTR